VRPSVRPEQVGRTGERDRNNPSIWEAMSVDPNLHVPADSLALQVLNNQRWSRRHLYEVVRLITMTTIRGTFIVKRAVPVPLGSQAALNWIAPRFIRRFGSPETLEFVLRHLAIETNLINFVARNSGATDVEEVTLMPTDANGLGDDNGLNAIARHDANIFNLVIDLGESETADVHTQRPLDEIDFSMLEIPEFDLERDAFRVMNLDVSISTQLTVMVLALLMDFKTAERAVNSFQLDESLLSSIANITGDPVFRTWLPQATRFGTWLGRTNDVGRDLHWHMIANEYAHTRLQWMRDSLNDA
jgi:hypothetical protein